MRIGSSLNNQAARPTELGSSDVFGGGVGSRTSRNMSSSVVCNRPLPASSWMSEGKDACTRGITTKRRLAWQTAGLLLSLPIGTQITRPGISALQISSIGGASNFAGAVGVSPGGGVSRT